MSRVRVLMVCMGNICRSPMAQGVFESLVAEAGLTEIIEVDSAGTHAYHVGEPPDHRARGTADRRGIDLSRQRARQVGLRDFEEFDYLLAMDRENLAVLQRMSPANHAAKVRLFLEFAADIGEDEVPDPYYGGPAGFERVFDLVEEAARGLLEEIRRTHLK